MANKGGNITTRQASKQSKKDGVSISNEESILINDDDFEDAPAWGKALANNMKELTKFVNLKMDETCAMITDYAGKIEVVSEKATSAHELATKNAESIKTLINTVSELTNDNLKTQAKLEIVCDENNKLKEHILKNESYSRRENLIFRCITSSAEPCEKIVRNILCKMNIAGICHETVPIVNCHNLNSSKTQIIVRFLMYCDRDRVWSSRRSLKTAAPEIYLAENFPSEIEYRRRQLYPMVAAANRADEYRQKVRLTGDKLIVNNQRYSHTTVNKLPNKLHPKTLSERTSESVIVVGGITSRHHPLSNFYTRSFVLEDKSFLCAEQAFQYHKSVLFNDQHTARQIMNSVDTSRMKYLGAKVNAFDYTVWKDKQDDIMKSVLNAKFTQHDDLRKALLDTGTKTIAEANAKDSYWAIGLPVTSPHVLNKDKWAAGGNKLGMLQMNLRQELVEAS